MLITLSRAAQQLTNKTGKAYSVDDLIELIEDSVHMNDGDARRLPGYAIAPSGAWDSVKRITRGPDGVDKFGKSTDILGDRVFHLDWTHAHGLALEGSSEVSRFRTGDFEWWANKSFTIFLDNVRVQKSDVESLADALSATQSTLEPTTGFAQVADELRNGADVETLIDRSQHDLAVTLHGPKDSEPLPDSSAHGAPSEKPANAPKPKIGRPSDVAEKQRVVLAIAEAFATVIPIGDDRKLPPTKKNFGSS